MCSFFSKNEDYVDNMFFTSIKIAFKVYRPFSFPHAKYKHEWVPLRRLPHEFLASGSHIGSRQRDIYILFTPSFQPSVACCQLRRPKLIYTGPSIHRPFKVLFLQNPPITVIYFTIPPPSLFFFLSIYSVFLSLHLLAF